MNSKSFPISTRRHSCAHVLAQAVLEMFPEAKLGTGPDTDNGFYYDIELPRTLIPEDLPILEGKMKRIKGEKQNFIRKELPVDDAIEFNKEVGQKFKVEIASDFKKKGIETISYYENLDPKEEKIKFVDMCEGPHVDHTGEIGVFKLNKIAAAYFRGDDKREQLQRIYGLCFESQKELDEYLVQLEEAEKRDHRKLGRELDMFMFDEKVGPGLPLWLPNGAVVVEELEKLAKETEYKAGYKRVRSPHLAKEQMYLTSGHLPYYKDSMFPPMIMDNETYYLKAMNCPHHHVMFANSPKSYRDLPLRYAEYGHCYRYEDSGALFGLMRVRSLCMNDAHIYCTEEQFEQEFIAVIDMYKYYFNLFGIEKYQMRLSLHDKEGLGKKYVDEPELWIKTEAQVRKVMQDSGVPFVEAENEAAFYGPKIDVQIWSAIGREFTLATNQLDFAVPKRFNLTYIDKDGKDKTPLCVHRAPLSTHERFIGFLLEHFAGAFPTWLAPVQVKIIPVSEKHFEYAEKIRSEFFEADIRVETDDSDEKLGKKIRNAELKKIPYMLVIGDKELESGSLAVRNYKTKEQKVEKTEEFLNKILEEIKMRRIL